MKAGRYGSRIVASYRCGRACCRCCCSMVRRYTIVEGQCNQICTKTKDKFKELEYQDDPSKMRTEAEVRGRMNPYKRYTSKDIKEFNKKKTTVMIGQ